MTLTQLWNHIVYLACALGMVLAMPGVVNLIPPKYQPIVGMLSAGVAWIKGHENLAINPDGTPASVAYRPPATKDRTPPGEPPEPWPRPQ